MLQSGGKTGMNIAVGAARQGAQFLARRGGERSRRPRGAPQGCTSPINSPAGLLERRGDGRLGAQRVGKLLQVVGRRGGAGCGLRLREAALDVEAFGNVRIVGQTEEFLEVARLVLGEGDVDLALGLEAG